jgi:hypothetical protein
MKQNEINELSRLRNENYENMFNVYQTDTTDKMYYYNLLQTLSFPPNLPEVLFTSYNIVPGDTWPYISYKNYSTPNLWWIILYANQIMDATKMPNPGSTIRIPKSQIVSEILTQISKK